MLGRIEPDSEYVSAAKAAHENVRRQLKDDEDVGKAHLDTFLSGSYRRSTAIGTIKDVDVICVVDIDWINTEAEIVIVWLQQALQRYYDRVRRQKRSVRVTTEKDVYLDIVLGTPMNSSDIDGPLQIPDREVQSWVPTHPKRQIEFAKQRNKATSGYFVQIVKISKHWRDRLAPSAARPASYVLETLVATSLGSVAPASHATGMVAVLEGIMGVYSSYVDSGNVPIIPDPGYPSVNVAKRWEADDFNAFMSKVSEAATIAQRALDSEDEDNSIKLWRRLFGNKFAPPD